MIFKVILEVIENKGLQYFINIGGNSLDEVLDANNEIGILTLSEKQKIENSQILKLYDKNPETWLFGQEFN